MERPGGRTIRAVAGCQASFGRSRAIPCSDAQRPTSRRSIAAATFHIAIPVVAETPFVPAIDWIATWNDGGGAGSRATLSDGDARRDRGFSYRGGR